MKLRPRRRLLCSSILVVIVIAGLTGCGERESGDIRADPPAPVVVAPTIDAGTAAPGLTAGEQRRLTKRLEDVAVREIKPQNAEAAAAELEQEIQADIGHE